MSSPPESLPLVTKNFLEKAMDNHHIYFVDFVEIFDIHTFKEVLRDLSYVSLGDRSIGLQKALPTLCRDKKYLTGDYEAYITGVTFSNKSNPDLLSMDHIPKINDDTFTSDYRFKETWLPKFDPQPFTFEELLSKHSQWKIFNTEPVPEDDSLKPKPTLTEYELDMLSKISPEEREIILNYLTRPKPTYLYEEVWITFNPPIHSITEDIQIYGLRVIGTPKGISPNLSLNYDSSANTFLTDAYIGPLKHDVRVFTNRQWYNPEWGWKIKGTFIDNVYQLVERAFYSIGNYAANRVWFFPHPTALKLTFTDKFGWIRADYTQLLLLIRAHKAQINSFIASFSWHTPIEFFKQVLECAIAIQDFTLLYVLAYWVLKYLGILSNLLNGVTLPNLPLVKLAWNTILILLNLSIAIKFIAQTWLFKIIYSFFKYLLLKPLFFILKVVWFMLWLLIVISVYWNTAVFIVWTILFHAFFIKVSVVEARRKRGNLNSTLEDFSEEIFFTDRIINRIYGVGVKFWPNFSINNLDGW